MTPFLV